MKQLMFSYELQTSPWSYYWLENSDLDDLWAVQVFHGELIQPGRWKDKDGGYYCKSCGCGVWNRAVLRTRAFKKIYEDYFTSNQALYYQAFAMGVQARLGAGSLVCTLDPSIVDHILRTITPEDYLSCLRK
jgi:hypothetical protein